VRLGISDAHQGLKNAIGQVLGCPWPRCTVHFLRDMLGHVSRTQQPLVSGAIRGIFTATTHAEAHQRLSQVAEQLRAHAPKVARLLEDAEPELLAFYEFPAEHWPKLRSTNPLERVTARSAGARMWSGSSPTIKRCYALPGCCCWSRTTSGWSAAATCRSPPWPS
jgi:putative transposase